MKNKKHIAVLLFFVLGFLVGCNQSDTSGEAGSEGETVSIQLGHHHPANSQVDQLANKLSELTAEISDGDIDISVYPGGQLGEELEAIESINMGSMDMSIISPGLMDDYSALFGIETMPFLFDDWDHADRSLNGEVGEFLRDSLLESSSIRVMGYMHLGFRHMITTENHQINGLDDMQGLSVRSPESWVWTRMFELLEANPTPVTWGEAYTALQTGVVEGMESPASGVIDMNFHEVTDHLFLSQHMFGTISLVINESVYEGLSEQHKDIMIQAAEEAIDYTNEEVTRPDEEKSIIELEEEHDMTITEIDAIEKWREKVEPMYDEFIDRVPESEEVFNMVENER
ncbi:TRAP transporter substrate-binding protein [Virgibacillus oceani]